MATEYPPTPSEHEWIPSGGGPGWFKHTCSKCGCIASINADPDHTQSYEIKPEGVVVFSEPRCVPAELTKPGRPRRRIGVEDGQLTMRLEKETVDKVKAAAAKQNMSTHGFLVDLLRNAMKRARRAIVTPRQQAGVNEWPGPPAYFDGSPEYQPKAVSRIRLAMWKDTLAERQTVALERIAAALEGRPYKDR